MNLRTNLWISTALRGLQILFGIVVLGLSVTLTEEHYDGLAGEFDKAKINISAVPFLLPWARAVVALTFMA